MSGFWTTNGQHAIQAGKTPVTFDFLHGILFACIVRDAWYFLPVHFNTSFTPKLVILSIAFTGIYAFLLWALLFRPVSSSKLLFGVLTTIAAIWVVGAEVMCWHALERVSMESWWQSLLVLKWQPAFSVLTAAVAFAYYYKVKSNHVALR